MVDCKISFDIGNFNSKEIISLLNGIHNDFIKDILSSSSELIDKGINIIRVNDIDNYLYDMHTNREELKDSFFHYLDFNSDYKLIYSALNILTTEDNWNLEKQLQSDTRIILGNKTLKNLCKFIIQHIFKIDLKVEITTNCGKGGETTCKGWFDYTNCPMYAYSLTVLIIFIIFYVSTLYIK